MRRLRRLITKRSARHAAGVFVAEGVEVIRTGIEAGHLPESLYVAADATGPGNLTADAEPGSPSAEAAAELASAVAARGVRVFDLASGVMARVADTVTPQPVLAVFPMVHVDLRVATGDARLVVVMADVRDPGNAGTVLRTADAAGVDAVIACGGTVDPYNPKTVRSSAGSLFHVRLVVAGSADEVLTALASTGFRRLGTAVGGDDYALVDWSLPTALVLGNEARGLPEGLTLDGTVGIPMAGRAESLNVGMACAVLCFDALRRRRLEAVGSDRPTMPR